MRSFKTEYHAWQIDYYICLKKIIQTTFYHIYRSDFFKNCSDHFCEIDWINKMTLLCTLFLSFYLILLLIKVDMFKIIPLSKISSHWLEKRTSGYQEPLYYSLLQTDEEQPIKTILLINHTNVYEYLRLIHFGRHPIIDRNNVISGPLYKMSWQVNIIDTR